MDGPDGGRHALVYGSLRSRAWLRSPKTQARVDVPTERWDGKRLG
jgi:hypothetical protein